MRNLICRCLETHQPVSLQLYTDYATLARIWSNSVRFQCPHCGATHETKVGAACLEDTLARTRTSSSETHGCQPQDRESPRPRRATDAACPRGRGDRVRRREFITLLGGAAAAWPLVAGAQEPGRIYRVGGLHASPRDAPHHLALYNELRRLGFIEGASDY
jgi:hypothetical protein